MKLHVLERGTGPAAPVLLLHGFTGSAEAWREGILAGLARTSRVLAVDLPGHGKSDLPSDPVERTFERVLEGLVGILDDRGFPHADWIGYSMGGRLALAAAVIHPERVRRLVLESASPGLASERERARRRREDEALARRIESQGVEAFVEDWEGRPLFASQRNLPPAVAHDVRRGRLRNRAASLAAALRGMGTGSQPSYWDRLGEIRARTLLLTGALDSRFAVIARRMADAIPDATHRSEPAAGHAVHLEATRAWLDAVTGFLTEPESTGAGPA